MCITSWTLLRIKCASGIGDRVTETEWEMCHSSNDNGCISYIYSRSNMVRYSSRSFFLFIHSNVTWCFSFFRLLCVALLQATIDASVWSESMLHLLVFIAVNSILLPFSVLINAIFMILAFEIQNPSGFLLLELESFATLILTGWILVLRSSSPSLSPSCSSFSVSVLVFNLNDCDSFHLIGK